MNFAEIILMKTDNNFKVKGKLVGPVYRSEHELSSNQDFAR